MAKTHFALAGATVILFSLTAVACSERNKAVAEQAAPVPVMVTRATMADAGETTEAGGIVQARTTATLASRILAPVREVRVVAGDRVRAGQVLVVLDGSALSAQARSARASAAAADQAAVAAASEQRATEAALVLARATHDRIKDLLARRSVTPQEYDEAVGALRAAEARATGAAAAAQSARSQIESASAASDAAGATAAFASITAPFDGVVSEKLVETGNMAAPGTPLLRIEDTRGFRLEVRVDESRLGRLAPGDRVPVSLDTGAGGSPTVVDGTVAEIARAADTDSRAFLVKIALPDTLALRSGTFGRARLTTHPRRALRVPEAAIVRRGQVTSVFVVENGVARLRLINANGTEVLAGLSEGETVVVTPPPALTDGRRVTVGGS